MFSALVANAPVLTDGAWGTELQARGLPIGACADEWNLTHPELVRDVALGYVLAGSEVILTNTFRSNSISLGAWDLACRVREINRTGAEISRDASQGRALVFGSIGPTGEVLALRPDLPELAYAAFAQQAAALAEGGVDAILIETLSDLEEARIAVRAACTTGLPVLASFAFDSGRNKDRTMTGVTPEQAAAAMTEEGASAIGANCGVGIDVSVAICARLRAATALPLWLKPNAGLPRLSDTGIIYDLTPDQFTAYLPALVDVGATFVGACCGSTPAFIEAAAKRLRAPAVLASTGEEGSEQCTSS